MYHAMACLTVPKLSDLGEHSEVSQARSLHACWTRMLYNDRLETIDNSRKNAGNSRFLTQTSKGRGIITTWHLLRSPKILCYIVDWSMLSILCVRLTIKVKVGIPESLKVGWYPPKKLGRVTLTVRKAPKHDIRACSELVSVSLT